jgi:asparagine synthase (glutamine-hydrolysing)
MCGTAVIVDLKKNQICCSTVKSMLQSISYRGPDESSIFHSPVATLGSVRLSIIDLGVGQQPLSDAKERY